MEENKNSITIGFDVTKNAVYNANRWMMAFRKVIYGPEDFVYARRILNMGNNQLTQDNILLITTDQQRFDTVQALGAKNIFTPHLNYMVGEGISFTRCYADCPICVPSRTTIMTGLRGFESGVISNATHEATMVEATKNRTTLPAMLTDAGYQTYAMGKMHFSPARACYGFEKTRLPLDYMREYDKKRTQASPKAHGVGECEVEPVISTVDTKDSITSWITDGAIDFIETRDPMRPFFMWTSYTKPHPPFDPCRDFWELYQDISVDGAVYGDWSEDIEKAPQGFLAGSYENTNMRYFTEEQVKVSKKAYYAMITQMDYSLGRLFGCLREKGLFENTWLIFTSDHGEMLGDHHMSQKNMYFEGSAHVPLIIVPPKKYNVKRNIKINTLTEIDDIYPTILAMAGITPTVGHGANLLQPLKERIFYGNSLDVNFCVMKDNIKLVYSARGDHYLLFDINKDPMERHDLSKDSEYAAVFEELKEILLEQVRTTRPDIIVDGKIRTLEPPKFPGDAQEHWFGFHYNDYSVDTFH